MLVGDGRDNRAARRVDHGDLAPQPVALERQAEARQPHQPELGRELRECLRLGLVTQALVVQGDLRSRIR
jgi:hypothetical protein